MENTKEEEEASNPRVHIERVIKCSTIQHVNMKINKLINNHASIGTNI